MLSEKQIGEIREHLEKAQNPIFYYDNDADGLCSFLLLRRFIGRGKGVVVRSFPDLNAGYARKAIELKADYVFVLDKPIISREFVEEIEKLGLPIVWIDHHNVLPDEFTAGFKNLFEYNSAKSGELKAEPVTFISYKVCEKADDAWLGVIGCIADHYLPDFVDKFAEMYPELWKKNVKDPFEAYFQTEIGKIAKAFNFGLKDSITNVVKLQNFLIGVKGPSDVFAEVGLNYTFRKKYNEVKKKYDFLLKKAKQNVSGKMIFFEYSGELSISADLANELCFLYPQKYVAVSFKNGPVANVSLRGKDVKKLIEKVLKEVEGTGGGHEDAVGARVAAKDLEKFKEVLEKEIKVL
jgi:single-stranded DNA-specific DHH superfamily exonuclease